MTLLMEEEERSGISFDPVIKDAAAFDLERRYHSSFYENITNEAIRI